MSHDVFQDGRYSYEKNSFGKQQRQLNGLSYFPALINLFV